jgi:hypothetical protein
MLSDCTKQIKDKESWLPSVLPLEGDVERELTSLLATAALVRGTFQAIPVPAGAEEASRTRYTAFIEEQWEQRRQSHDPQRPWPAVLGSWLRVVFTLGRRR